MEETKAKRGRPRKAVQENTPTKKHPGLLAIVYGDAIIKNDRKREIKKYEERFTLPLSARDKALSVILRCLLNVRLSNKFELPASARTYFIKPLQKIEDTGLYALEKKGIFEMDSEEIRHYAILKEVKDYKYRKGPDGKMTLIKVLDAPRIIKEMAVDFDIASRVDKILKDAAARKSPPPPQAEEETPPELQEEEAASDGEVAATGGEKWEALDGE